MFILAKRLVCRSFFLSWLFCSGLSAQNTGGIIPTVVVDGHQSVQYRMTFVPNSDGFAQRVHYERGIGDLMWRVVAQTRKTPESSTDFDFAQGELFWHFTESDRRWQSGLRFDVQLRSKERPDLLAMSWNNEIALGGNWHARAVARVTRDIGGGSRAGIGLQTRGSIYIRTGPGQTLGLELFSSHGTTAELASLDDGQHQLGPFATLPIGSNWNIFAGALFGLSDSVPDSELRFWSTYRF